MIEMNELEINSVNGGIIFLLLLLPYGRENPIGPNRYTGGFHG